MSPNDQQFVSQMTDSIQAFRELGVALAILFVLGLFGLGFIVWVYTNYRLRSTLAKRDEARALAETDTDNRNAALLEKSMEMYSSISAAMNAVKATMEVVSVNIVKNTESNLSLETRTAHLVNVEQQTQNTLFQAQQSIESVKGELQLVKGNLEQANQRLTAIETMLNTFPRYIEFKSDIQELKEMARKCADKTDKLATDETPLLPQPDNVTALDKAKSAPEELDRQEPGVQAA